MNLSTLPPKLFFGIGAFGSVIISGILIATGRFEIPKELWII
jgi:hypothetical protein